MGGMHGFGPVVAEANEPVFHETWERRMFGIRRAMTSPPGSTIDQLRHQRELMPPAAYLSWSYYERWYFSAALSLLQAGMTTFDELRTGRVAPGRSRRDDAVRPKDVDRLFKTGGNFARPADAPAGFAAGEGVRTRNMHPLGHTRLPRYARGKSGVVHRLHGAHVLPDTNAHGRGECPEHLYTVMFTARTLWGEEASPRDKVYLDLWESYLEPD
ncbi:MAG: nitrile hydratase subunit beta [Geminicoccaceae bacterium]